MKKIIATIAASLLVLLLAGCGPSYEDGYKEGLEEGTQQGYEEGYSSGYEKGFSAGKEEGTAQGKELGLIEGQKSTDSYKYGYDNGYNAGMYAQFDLGRDEDLEAAYEYILDNSDILREDALERYYDSYSEYFYERFSDEGLLKED